MARVLVAMEWAEELLWRIARVRCAVIDSMRRHPSGVMPVPSGSREREGRLARCTTYFPKTISYCVRLVRYTVSYQ
jgi:hypothetical protein